MLVGLKMTNLTTATQIVKKAGIILALFLVITALVALIIFRVTRKPTTEPPVPISSPSIAHNSLQKQPSVFDFTNVQSSEIPEELPTFFAHPYKITEEASKTLATNLGFPENPTSSAENTLDGKEYTWIQDDLRLIISQTSLQYSNTRYRSEELPIAGELSLDKLQEKAASFIQKIAVLKENLEIDSKKTKYWVISENNRVRTDSFKNTQMVTFSYQQKLAGLPIVSNDPTTSYLMVMVKRDGEVIHLFSRFFDKFSQESPML